MKRTTRRRFLKSSTLGLAPMIVPSSVFGKDGATAPNDRVQLGCIGVGGMGTGNLKAFLKDERVEVVAICDVDAKRRAAGLKAGGLKAEAGFEDFRELLKRPDIDAVMIATPDHWHALITGTALLAGKDVYCEKPLAASIAEGRYVSDLVAKEERVLQCGTWRRSGIHTRKACELVRNGYIGELKVIEAGVPAAFEIRGGYTGLEKPQKVPKEFNYELWLGPANKAPYTAARCHFNFRWLNDYAPGYITDWGAHFLDVAQWGNGTDDTTPVSVIAHDVFSRDLGLYDAPEGFRIDYQYASGVKMTMFSSHDQSTWGTKWIGDKGTVFTENSKIVTSPTELRRVKIKDDEIHLYESKDHHRNFIDCVYARTVTAAPAETAHRAATCCHLGAIAAAVGGELKFDPKAERFTNSDEANKMLRRPMREPWALPV